MGSPLVAITMRADIIPERRERRDALDQRLSRYIAALGGVPVPVVNDRHVAELLMQEVRPAAVVLSGGNDLATLGGDAPDRDAVEHDLLNWAFSTGIPVLGICRGMQMIAVEAGARLSQSDNHVCEAHTLFGSIMGEVPSHHSWCIDKVPPSFVELAAASDGTCEAFLRQDHLVLGMMWHPERAVPERPADAALIKSVLKL